MFHTWRRKYILVKESQKFKIRLNQELDGPQSEQLILCCGQILQYSRRDELSPAQIKRRTHIFFILKIKKTFQLYQFSSITQLCPTLWNPMNRSLPGLPVHHQLPEFTQTHVHWVSDAIQPSHPLSSPSPPAPNPSQQQSLFQWVNSLCEVAKVLEFQL